VVESPQYPQSVESRFLIQAAWLVVLVLINSNSIGVSMPRLEWRRRRLWKTSRYSKIAFASSTRVFQRRESSSSTCRRTRGRDDAALPIEVQLHAGDLGQADRHNPEDRRKAAQSYIESVGGKLHGFWYAFGTHDGYNLWEAPDVSMAAVAPAITGGGALSSFENDGPPERRRND
jgi:hypothetical protein